MPARYTSFVIRHWRLASGARRIVVEHVQSGEQSAVATLAAATAWLAAHADGTRPSADEWPPEGTDRCDEQGER